MNVLLIWPYGMKGKNFKDHCVFPLGLGYVYNAIKSIDGQVNCKVLDCALDGIQGEQIISCLGGIDVVAISCWGFNLNNVAKSIEVIRRNSDAIIIAGGPSSYLVHADYCIVGEGEYPFRALIDKLLKGNPEQVEIEGAFKFNEKVSFPKVFSKDLDQFGLIDYDVLQLGKYLENGYKDWLYSLKDKFSSAPLMVTRGCPYHCSYCQGPVVMGHKIRKHSKEYVIETIQSLYQKHTIRQFSILDDNFTFDADFAKELCDAIITMKHDMGYNFWMTTVNGVRVNKLDDELLGLMKKAGWSEIVISPESGSARTLKRMRKVMDLEGVTRKIDLIHKNRMNVVGNFMCGYPGETVEDLESTKKFILNNDFDRCNVSIFNPIPGTPIYNDLLTNGEIDETPKSINYKAVSYLTEDLTKENIYAFISSVKEKTQFKEKWIKDL